MSEIGDIPEHTFSEGVIVDGKTYFIKGWKELSFDGLNTEITFCADNKRPYAFRIDDYPITLRKVRESVIKQIKHLDSIGWKWERREND